MTTYEKQMATIFKHYLDPGTQVILFGSRAAGTAHATSDYDFALKAESQIPMRTLFAIKEAFHESTIPFKVDVVDIHSVSEPLYSEIRKKGRVWTL